RRKSSVYAFFNPEPEIDFKKDGTTPDYLVFSCSHCRTKVRQGLNTSDKGSTGNLIIHVKKCWGEEAFNAAKDSSLEKARLAVKTFGKKGQAKLTATLKTTKSWAKMFSTRPPEKEMIRGYRWLQKEGRPNHYVPSKDTVARDVKKLYKATKAKLADELQVCEYKLALALDCWTSPNHHAIMSITVSWVRKHTEDKEELTTKILDFLELPCSHTGANMAEA
ncbi:hypothetical protein EV360DRAFT_28664, partial [Lentinula raphanica]